MSVLIEQSRWAIEADLEATVQAVLGHIAQPGSWWNAVQRLAIAREARGAASCPFCIVCKEALSPYSPDGTHTSAENLPDAAVDAIHRMVNDPGRLTKTWCDGLMTGDFSQEQYVELTSVVSHLIAVDTLCRGLGIDAPRLPSPQPGDPSGERSAEAKVQMAWVPTVSHKDATGALADDWFPTGKRGYVPHVAQALTLVPAEALSFKRTVMTGLYLDAQAVNDPTRGMRALERPQAELLAARVSALNECYY